MKKLLSLLFIILLNTSLIQSLPNPAVYNDADINALQNIYNHHTTALIHWNLSVPEDIEEVEWECIDDVFRVVSLDLSDTDISGNIDLSHFEYIEHYSFSNTNINEIILPEYLNSIPKQAFYSCGNLEYINIPQCINKIENSAFRNCSNLKSVILNNSDTTISSEAFSGCVSLECIVNANNISSIGRNAFSNCDQLAFYDNDVENVYIKNYTQDMGYTFSTNVISTLAGYVSVMTNGKEQISRGYPYKLGTAYLYDENSTLIEEIQLNSEGQFSFNNLSIGHKYRIVIDGQFAIARDFYVIATQANYTISTKDESLPVITCDFNKDGIITNTDTQILFWKCASSDPNEKELYDLNGDNVVNVSDAGVLFALLAYLNENGYIY